MRILLVHNRYRRRSGEDVVFDRETALLQEHGHEVVVFLKDNQTLDATPRVVAAANALWSQRSRIEVGQIVRESRPDIVHFHNTHPLISPAAYYAVRAHGVSVIQTLHNFRLLCPNALFFRAGAICEDCLGKAVAWPGVLHACYRDSRSASATVAGSIALHRGVGTWTKVVDRYVALTSFAKSKFIEGGLPPQRVVVKPNFVPDRGHVGGLTESSRTGGLFVGRLSLEKGLLTLIQAWHKLHIPLKIIGDGPLANFVRDSGLATVHCLGGRSLDEVEVAMRRASFLVMPSQCYEGFALVLVEAFCQSLPVIASRLGSMAEIVEDGVTGLHFTPGDHDDLVAKVRWADEHPDELLRMGENARRVYEDKYTPEVNHRQLMTIYQETIDAGGKDLRQKDV